MPQQHMHVVFLCQLTVFTILIPLVTYRMIKSGLNLVLLATHASDFSIKLGLMCTQENKPKILIQRTTINR